MRFFISLFCVLAFLAGVGAFASGSSAVHQILGAVFLLIGVICLVGMAILESLNSGFKTLHEALETKT